MSEQDQFAAGSPLVSIALPVFNAESTLALAIRSIQKQTYAHWELIIIDDGSTDNSRRVARSFDDPRIRIVSEGVNRGIAACLNTAIEFARGEYFARMDADDISFPERIESQVRYLTRHPEVDLLGTGVLVFREGGHPLGTIPIRQEHEEICRRPWLGFSLAHPTWLGRRSWFVQNLYRPWVRKAQDQDLLLRSHDSSRFACLPDVLVGYREEPRHLKKMFRSRFFFLRSALDVFLRSRRYDWALCVLCTQAAKMSGDVLNIIFGMEKMRNPLLPLSSQLHESWKKVWQEV